MNTHKIIIIGSGPAGLTAAIYAARAELKPLVIAGVTFGGQLMNTTEVENFPGFVQGILGPQLMQDMLAQAERFGAEIVYDNAVSVNFKQSPFKVATADKEYLGESVIVATGASWRYLGIPSEQKFLGKGISFCATCDGFFFKDKEVFVIGGGDAALEEAHYVSKFAKHVTILNRGAQMRASQIMQSRTKDNEKISIEYNKGVEEFLGETKLTQIRIKDNVTNAMETRAADGVFVAIGHRPNSELFKDHLDMDEKGFIKVSDQTKTSVPGVFVAGDVKDARYRQAVTSAGMGCMAALDAEKYLEQK
jgi:thioredoxin reductase (NADPH)